MIGRPIYLVCAATSGEEFVAAFRRYADKGGVFVPMADPLPANKRGRFALALADGGVMIEGEAEIVASSKAPSPLYGRVGMTIRFVELDDASRTVLAELDRARLLQRAVAPSVPPRAVTDVPAAPRAVLPAVSGRIDAQNLLAESVAIGDVAALVEVGPKQAGPKFVIPSIPGAGGASGSGALPRAKTPSAFPLATTAPGGSERTRTPTQSPPVQIPALGAPRAKTATGLVPKSGDTQPIAVVPPPRAADTERRSDRSASLPPLEALKVGTTQAVAVVPPPQWAAKNLFAEAEAEAAADSDTHRVAPDLALSRTATLQSPPPKMTRPPPMSTRPPETAALADDDLDWSDDAAPAVTPVPLVTVTHTVATAPPLMRGAPTPTAMAAVADADLEVTGGLTDRHRPGFLDDAVIDDAAIDHDDVIPPPAPASPVTPSLAELVRSAAAKKGPRIDANPTLRGTGAPLNRQQIAQLAAETDEMTDLTSTPLQVPPELRSTAVGVGVPPAHDTEMIAAQDGPPAGVRAMLEAATDPGAVSITKPLAPAPRGGEGDGDDGEVAIVVNRVAVEEPTPSGNWTMTLDADGGAPKIEPLPTKPKSTIKSGGGGARDGGDWTITPEQEAPSWIGSAPKPQLDVVSGVAGGARGPGNPSHGTGKPGNTKVIEAVTAPSMDIGGTTEPKIQIDPTLGLGQAPVSGSIAAVREPPALPPLPPTPIARPQPQLGMQPAMPMQAVSSSMMAQQGPPMIAPTPPPMMPMPMTPPPMPVSPYPGQSAYAQPPMPVVYVPSGVGPATDPYGSGDHTAQLAKTGPSGGKRTAIILGILLLVVAIVGALLYFALAKKAGPQPPATPPTTAHVAPPPPATTPTTPSQTPPPTPPAIEGSGSAAMVTDVGSGSGPGPGPGSGSSAAEELPAGECIVDVVTAPTEAAIYDDHNLRLGTAPAQVKVPCGVTRLILRKDTYAESVRAVTTKPGVVAKLRAGLVHAALSIKVSSTPSGAAVSVGGRSKGVTPTTMQLPMFESSTIVFTKDGYATDSEKIVPRQSNQAVHVVLKRKGRR